MFIPRLSVCLVVVLCLFPSFVARASAQTTALYARWDASSSGPGSTTLTPSSATFQAFPNLSGVSINVFGTGFSWGVELAAGPDVPLTPGEYPFAAAFGRTTLAALGISGPGLPSCSYVTGRFVVYEVEFGVYGDIAKFSADVEQHCNDGAEATVAAIRINSSIASLTPFDNEATERSLTITPSALGSVAGGGLNCGNGQTACTISLADPAAVTITAVPNPGFIFTGWSGACSGDAETIVNVTWAKTCAATFDSADPTDARTTLVVDSQPGTIVWNGEKDILTPLNSHWRVDSLYSRQAVSILIMGVGPHNDQQASLEFIAPTGETLGPGLYAFGPRAWALGAGLDVTVGSLSCSPSGRFVVHELDISDTEDVLTFSADAEVRCGDDTATTFLAVRYTSLIDDVRPFEGSYPVYELRVTPPEHGTITGPGVACGTGGAACLWSDPAASPVDLTASPDSGYVFVGWTGACSGSASSTVAIDVVGVLTCGAVFQPTAGGPITVLVIDSEENSIGRGQKTLHNLANSAWDLLALESGNGIDIGIQTSYNQFWFIQLRAPAGQSLQPGLYAPVMRGTSPAFASLNITGKSVTCSATGRFLIHEIDVVEPVVSRLAVDIEHRCSPAGEAMYMAIRYNSTISQIRPFAGLYPRYGLTIDPPANGRIEGPGISCGGGGIACVWTTTSAGSVTLSASPDPGYLFMGWSGTCVGGPTTTVAVNSELTCSARFEPVIASSRRTFATWSSHPDHFTSRGQSHTFSLANSGWTVTSVGLGNAVHVELEALGSSWSLRFAAPSGQKLQTASYTDPGSGANAASLLVSNTRVCNDVGTFVVRELSVDPNTSKVVAFAVDFEHWCTNAPNAVLRGRLQFNASTSMVAHKSAHDFNDDGRLDLFWQHDTDGWIATWEMHDVSLLQSKLTTPEKVADTSWKIVGTADFNSDGKPDLLWQNRQSGLMTVWYMNGSTYLGPGLLTNNTVSDLNWQIRSLADFNGDGKADILWHHATQGTLAVWFLDGVTFTGSALLTPSAVTDVRWTVVGTGDFNNDGSPDILWRHRESGLMTVWYMSGTTFASTGLMTPNTVADLEWEIRAIADINDDGMDDLIWQHRSQGHLSVWLMGGVQLLGGTGLQPGTLGDPNWRLVGPR